MAMGVKACGQYAQLAVHVGNPQPLAEDPDQLGAALFVAQMARPFLGRRGPLAEIVDQHREPGHDIRAQAHRLRQGQQGMHADVDFGMMERRVGGHQQSALLCGNMRRRPPVQPGLDDLFREDRRQRAAVA